MPVMYRVYTDLLLSQC